MNKEMRDILERVVERWKRCRKIPNAFNQEAMDEVVDKIQDIFLKESLKDRVTTVVPARKVGDVRPKETVEIKGQTYEHFDSFQAYIESLPKVKHDIYLWDEEHPFGVVVGEKYDLDNEQEDDIADAQMRAEYKQKKKELS